VARAPSSADPAGGAAAPLVRLTTLARTGGCAAKVPAAELARLLGGLPAAALPERGEVRLLVAAETFDDAAVVQLRAGLAIVQTVDFFTPVVDDPRVFGRIAACNAISDVYAMGGEPLFALAVAGVPDDLPAAAVEAIFAGGAEAMAEAGGAILGGHTIRDPEPKYGLVVTGTVDPDRIWRNRGGRDGDVLVLTKALGTGIVANAARSGEAPPDALAAAIASMSTLNGAAADRLRPLAPHAVTDVTGFGLLGHLHELAAASGLAAVIDASALPLLPGARALTAAGHVPGGSRRNRAAAAAYADIADDVHDDLVALACDAQTSGGLLAALPADRAAGAGTPIGRLVAGPAGRIRLQVGGVPAPRRSEPARW
jgi:selenide,water dikinase